jgi:hypothetical protein
MYIQKNSNLVFIQVYKPYLFIIYIPIISLYILARGNETCQRRPGSLGYEKKDANTYAIWRVDYLKLDSCFNTNGTPPAVEIALMRDALNASGRSIFFSICDMYTNF